MQFPTGGEGSAFGFFMYYRSLEALLRRRAPQYADRIERPDTAPYWLGIRLGNGTKVLLALTGMAWMIADPSPQSRPRFWEPRNLDDPHSPGTSDEVLVDALTSRATACLTGEPEPSPWCWDEAEESAQTLLADCLAASGFDVRTVVNGNRAFTDDGEGTPLNPVIRFARRSDGAFVRACLGQLDVHIALKPSVGWVADIRMPDDRFWRRLDLARLLGDRPSVEPGIAGDKIDVSALAQAITASVAGLVGESGSVPPLAVSQLSLVTRTSASGERHARLTAAQLHAMGFSDVEVQEVPGSPLRSDTFHITWRDQGKSSLGQPDLERLIGRSTTEGKRLMVISSGRVTQDAMAVANRPKSSVFVFYLDLGNGLLFGGNDRATEAYLTGTSPLELLERLLSSSDIDGRALADAIGKPATSGKSYVISPLPTRGRPRLRAC